MRARARADEGYYLYAVLYTTTTKTPAPPPPPPPSPPLSLLQVLDVSSLTLSPFPELPPSLRIVKMRRNGARSLRGSMISRTHLESLDICKMMKLIEIGAYVCVEFVRFGVDR